MARYLAFILVLAVLATGCATKKAGLDTRGEFYASEDARAFLDSTAAPEVEDEYIIGIGDRLDVIFFLHSDLSTVGLLVRSDGRISLPYVGDVTAAGTTPMALDSTLTARFSEVLRDPNLSVIVREPAERWVYVLGQVSHGGGFKLESRMTVLQAIALAGGLDRGAKTSHVVLIRRDGSERIVGVEVNLAAVTSGYDVANDVWLKNYDIVYVPATRLQTAGEFISIVYDILYPPVDLMLRGWTAGIMFQQLEYYRSRN